MRYLRLLAFVFGAVLPFSGVVAAQHSYGYVFAGAATIPGQTHYTYWHDDYIHVGGGGEAGIGKRFTLGGEIGALISTAQTYGRNAGVFSFGPGFHFIPRSEQKFDPFVTGGVSLLAAGGVGVMYFYGGGVNYWFHRRIGLRMEFRDHVWVPEGSTIHFVGARIGVCIR